MTAPTSEQRAEWRRDAESLAMAYGGTCDDHDYDRILDLLDALDATEAQWHRYIVDAERATARAERAEAALARVEALAELGVREQWPPDEWRAAILRAPLNGAER